MFINRSKNILIVFLAVKLSPFLAANGWNNFKLLSTKLTRFVIVKLVSSLSVSILDKSRTEFKVSIKRFPLVKIVSAISESSGVFILSLRISENPKIPTSGVLSSY